MKFGVRGKLFAVSVLIVLTVGLGSGLYLESNLKEWFNSRIEGELLQHARTCRDLIELAELPETIADLDHVADRLGGSTGARITIIAANGTVLGDSNLDVDDVRKVENHRQRPEVTAAGTQTHGVSRRYSTTVRTDMLYVAVPYTVHGSGGVVRVSMPLSEIDQAIMRLRLALTLAALLGLALAIFMTGLASHLATRAIRTLVDSARAVVRHEGERRLPVPSADEIGGLAGSFNRVVEELDGTVKTLAGERDHLETILNAMRDGVLVLNAEQKLTRSNHAARALVGAENELSGQSLLEAVRDPELARLAADSMQEVAEAEFDLPGPVHVHAHAAPLRTGGCVIVLRDVTRTQQLEKVRRDFVANVSHELRTPIAVIRANAETLLNGAIDDKENAKKFSNAILRHAERLTTVIADLLDLTNFESGTFQPQRTPLDIQAISQRVVELLSEQAAQKSITLDVEVSGGESAIGDARSVEQILVNYLDNAIKYTPARGRVTISLQNDSEETVRIEVCDDGAGVSAEHRDRVFERFYRVDPGRSRDVGGTGLGLSIVRNLAELMGGRVGVDPAQPHGSVFWFTLPRC